MTFGSKDINLARVRVRKNPFFAIYAKTIGLRQNFCCTSVYKVDYCAHFKPKIKFLRTSEAKIYQFGTCSCSEKSVFCDLRENQRSETKFLLYKHI